MSHDPVPLETEADAFLRGLPDLTYPASLVARFPHIVNRIYALRGDPIRLRDYFQELTEDHRGDRKGFDFDTLLDIQSLRETLIGDVNGFVSNDDTKWVS